LKVGLSVGSELGKELGIEAEAGVDAGVDAGVGSATLGATTDSSVTGFAPSTESGFMGESLLINLSLGIAHQHLVHIYRTELASQSNLPAQSKEVWEVVGREEHTGVDCERAGRLTTNPGINEQAG
jgi:hypothetical protein